MPCRDRARPRVRMKEREARGASYDSRRPDIPRQDSLTRGSGRPIAPTQRMNMRPWFGSAVLACAIHSFLGGGNKQPVELLADEDGDYPASVVDAQMDGRTASGADAKCAMSAIWSLSAEKRTSRTSRFCRCGGHTGRAAARGGVAGAVEKLGEPPSSARLL
jgi:hypothetical protein